jgi:hypothetical protein
MDNERIETKSTSSENTNTEMEDAALVLGQQEQPKNFNNM